MTVTHRLLWYPFNRFLFYMITCREILLCFHTSFFALSWCILARRRQIGHSMFLHLNNGTFSRHVSHINQEVFPKYMLNMDMPSGEAGEAVPPLTLSQKNHTVRQAYLAFLAVWWFYSVIRRHCCGAVRAHTLLSIRNIRLEKRHNKNITNIHIQNGALTPLL